MKGDQCPNSEIVFKAILQEHYDAKEERFHSSLFKGPESSLSRLAVWSKKQIINGFIDQLHKPPKHFLMGVGSATVSRLKQICIEYKDKPTAIDVIEDPLDGTQKGCHVNPSHAIIPQRLSPGLAKDIPKKIEIEWGTLEQLLSNAERKGCFSKFFRR
jgi:hypothetical protein